MQGKGVLTSQFPHLDVLPAGLLEQMLQVLLESQTLDIQSALQIIHPTEADPMLHTLAKSDTASVLMLPWPHAVGGPAAAKPPHAHSAAKLITSKSCHICSASFALTIAFACT